VIALARSTLATLASVHNHATTSANSSSRFGRSSPESAVASPPPSSMKSAKGRDQSRARSYFAYLVSMCFWKSAIVSAMGSMFSLGGLIARTLPKYINHLPLARERCLSSGLLHDLREQVVRAEVVRIDIHRLRRHRLRFGELVHV